jgi:hypothetical protein
VALSTQQLDTWSNQGAATSSAATYASIKAALAAHTWPSGMEYDVYLQGSYPNATNIRGNSDVDVVVEMTSSFYNDLTEDEKRARNLTTAKYNIDDLRREVISALVSYYGASAVDTSGPNAIVVAANGSRLKADVLPCVTYHEYNHGNTPVEGIKFGNQHTNQPKINFPKLHISSGQTKNQNATSGRYKPSVRMMKNARERIIGSDDDLRKKYPSYFVECLIFNVPDDQFTASRPDTFVNIINFLHRALRDDRGPKFITQSKQRYLFGNDSTQWSIGNATAFVDQLVTLWNNG